MSKYDSAKCPNCGTEPIDEYDIGSADFREFDCPNTNCRCQVFKVIPDDSE